MRLHQEVNALVVVLTRLTGLPSRWNGEISLVPGADFKGKKRFSCGIELHADLANQEVRWLTLIHEVLHSLSVGYVASVYQDFPGWEEGVVEQLQRYFRPLVLAELGILGDTKTFLTVEKSHKYNVYVQALERLRLLIDVEAIPFYLDLLRLPIKQRSVYVYGLGRHFTGNRKFEYLHAFSASNAILKTMLD